MSANILEQHDSFENCLLKAIESCLDGFKLVEYLFLSPRATEQRRYAGNTVN
jgi:hypothetical protein